MKSLSFEKMETMHGGWPSMMEWITGSHCAGAVISASVGVLPLAAILGASCAIQAYGHANGNLD